MQLSNRESLLFATQTLLFHIKHGELFFFNLVMVYSMSKRPRNKLSLISRTFPNKQYGLEEMSDILLHGVLPGTTVVVPKRIVKPIKCGGVACVEETCNLGQKALIVEPA